MSTSIKLKELLTYLLAYV